MIPSQRWIISFFVFSLTCFSERAPVLWAAQEETLLIGSNKQLFIDDYIAQSVIGLSRVLNQPIKYPGNPVLSMVAGESKAWDAGMPIVFSSILYEEEEQLFKMWYGLHQGEGGDEESFLCYAISQDGIRWQKPSLGKIRLGNTNQNNILMSHSGLACGVFRDWQEKDPAQRYKMLHMWKNYKVYASHSSDGLSWIRYNKGNPVLFVPPGHDSHMIAYWDKGLNKYVAIVRDRTGRITDVRPRLTTDVAAGQVWRLLWAPNGERSPKNHSIRRVGQAVSEDFVRWTDYRPILGPDDEDPLNQDQFYNMEVLPYQGLRIGMMTVFSYDPRFCRGAVQLTYSRDGTHWHRGGNRQVFIPLSDRPGDFDWGSIYPLQAPLIIGDEIWIYYTAYGVDHNHRLPPGTSNFSNGIGLAKLRLDGFVSLDAGTSEGILVTKPFSFTGSQLKINAAALSGSIQVEILANDGLPMDGYGKARCVMENFDQIRQVVRWKGQDGVHHLQGKVIQLKFYLRKAKLFSFWFDVFDRAKR